MCPFNSHRPVLSYTQNFKTKRGPYRFIEFILWILLCNKQRCRDKLWTILCYFILVVYIIVKISAFRGDIHGTWILSAFFGNIHVPWILSVFSRYIYISWILSTFRGNICILWILSVFCGNIYRSVSWMTVKLYWLVYGSLDEQTPEVGKPISSCVQCLAIYS